MPKKNRAKALMTGRGRRAASRIGPASPSDPSVGRSREAGAGFATPRKNFGRRGMTTELPGKGITPPKRRPVTPKPGGTVRKAPKRPSAPGVTLPKVGITPPRRRPKRGLARKVAKINRRNARRAR